MRLLFGFTAAVAVVTATVSPPTLAATQHGALWRLATSALIADRPTAASIAGLLVVGIATVAVAGPRIAATVAVIGHVGSALVVYALLDLAHTTVTTLDYGTSAILAAWIGVLAAAAWSGGHRRGAVALVVVSALVGWWCKGTLTVLDWEHAVALAVGYSSAAIRSMPVAITDSSTMLNESRTFSVPRPSG